MFRAVLISLLGTIAISVAITPLVFSSLLYIFPALPWPFSRVFDRVIMVVLIGFLLAFRKTFSLGEISAFFKREIALKPKLLKLAFHALLTFLLSTFFLYLAIDGQNIRWSESPGSYILWKTIKVIPAALLISLLEEAFFRVLLLENLKKYLHVVLASIVSSVFYAFVHFLSPVKTFAYEGFRAFAGFEYILLLLSRFSSPAILMPLFGLFIVGLTLCFVITRTRSIYPCIGLHAGWVMAIKLSLYATVVTETSDVGRRYFFVGNSFGLLSIFLIFLVLFLLDQFCKDKKANE